MCCSSVALRVQVAQLARCMRSRGIFFDVVLIRPHGSPPPSLAKLAASNEALLRLFPAHAAPGSSFTRVASLSEGGLLHSVKARVLPTSAYRGEVQVAPGLSFKVTQLGSKRGMPTVVQDDI